jgi:cytosine deaminase
VNLLVHSFDREYGWTAKIAMELIKVKTARFRDVVSKCGRPEVATLWQDPKKDADFQKALKACRVMSVHQTVVGSKKDFAEVGWVKKGHIALLIFPASLKEFSEKRIIGVDYDLVDQPKTQGKPVSRGKASAAKSQPKKAQAKSPAKPKLDPFMMAAIDEARKGLAEGGIPIGSSLVQKGKLVAVGHNKRVQDNDPVTHGETDCLRNAGRLGSFRGCTLYSTLMPCYFCAGAAVQFGIKKVIVGESRNFPGAPEFMREHGIEVIDLDLPECYEMMEKFIRENPKLWNEDIGVED